MDASGRVLARRRLPEGVAGMAQLHALIGAHAGDDLPRAFRTAYLRLIYAVDCRSTYSSWTCCGLRY
jgi:hypothetical protein